MVRDRASRTADNVKVCYDNLSGFQEVLDQETVVDITPLAADSLYADRIAVIDGHTSYKHEIKTILHELLGNMDMWKVLADQYSGQIDDKQCTLKVVNECQAQERCANYTVFRMSTSVKDVGFEVTESPAEAEADGTQLTNLISVIEVKFLENPKDIKTLLSNFQQLVSFLVTHVRPIVCEDDRWLLRGMLVYRKCMAFVITIESNDWLDYPWRYKSVTRYNFDGYGLVEVLRRFLHELFDGPLRADQLFKPPNELTFPKYPDNVEFIASSNNVVKCKWSDLAGDEYRALFPNTEQEAKDKCKYTKLHTLPAEKELVLKVVSPTIYQYDGKPTGIVGDLNTLLLNMRSGFALNEFEGDDVHQRLTDLYNMYVHVTPRGSCESSYIVVTTYQGERICANGRLNELWQNEQVRKRFFEQVVLTVFDVVQYLQYAHSDIRPPNVVYNEQHGFSLIDWENVQSITAKCTVVDDQRYPPITAPNDRCRWLISSAHQLYMTVYIIEKVSTGSDAYDVEGEIHGNVEFWANQWSEDATNRHPATSDFPQWRADRRFDSLVQCAAQYGNDSDGCRSALEVVLKSALGIE